MIEQLLDVFVFHANFGLSLVKLFLKLLHLLLVLLFHRVDLFFLLRPQVPFLMKLTLQFLSLNALSGLELFLFKLRLEKSDISLELDAH